jgi:fido (protein-threonine AMPylation protein)
LKLHLLVLKATAQNSGTGNPGAPIFQKGPNRFGVNGGATGLEPATSCVTDIEHLQGIHRYLFQDVYKWAGDFRTVDIAKGDSYFAHVPYIESTLKGLFGELSEERHLRGLNQERFASRLAQILGTLNAVHAFREGNGRAQREFVRELASRGTEPEATAEKR